MGFIDKMCYNIAENIIEEFFWKNYSPTIVIGRPWYENLDNFLVNEWERLKSVDNEIEQFNVNEEHTIICDAMQIILDKLVICGDEWEEHENDVSWDKFDDIIGRYTRQYKPKMYGVDGKELKNEFCPAAGGG